MHLLFVSMRILRAAHAPIDPFLATIESNSRAVQAAGGLATNLLRKVRLTLGDAELSCSLKPLTRTCLTAIELMDQRIAELERLIVEASPRQRQTAKSCDLEILLASLRDLRRSKTAEDYAQPTSWLSAAPTVQPRQHSPAPMKAPASADFHGPICQLDRRVAGASSEAASVSKNTAAPVRAATGQGTRPASPDAAMTTYSIKPSQLPRDKTATPRSAISPPYKTSRLKSKRHWGFLSAPG